ncbi:MAG: Rpn family recombination-promoting nuclease/putative transposase [Methylococcaceae bacterium]|nr:Rpn family recombination-promoting nuclease/putative transposase [Methylococcaceae bacterium]
MKHRIDPKIDCVFKALLGCESNRGLLIHFLNAMLYSEIGVPVVEVELLNPYNEKEFLDDKLSIVDVKAKDREERVFQVEIQLLNYRSLPTRMVYTWADLYSAQLAGGRDYPSLRSTYSIWLLAEDLIRDDRDYAHHYKLRDAKGKVLVEHGGIWLLELSKFEAESVENDEQRWLKFFKHGDQLDDENLPIWMNTNEMRQAMTTLKRFSEKERDYHAYQARQNFLRQQRTMQWERDQEHREKLEALRQKEEALQREEAALQREEAALREKQAAEREKQAAIQREKAALREIERLKTLIDKQSPE